MRAVLEDALPLISQTDGAQVVVVVDGGGGGGAAAAGDDDDAGRGFCAALLLLTAVVGVVIEGGVDGGVVEVGDPVGGPSLIRAAGHQAGFGWRVGADGHAGHRSFLKAAQAAGEEAPLLHQTLQLQLDQAGFRSFSLFGGVVHRLLEGGVRGAVAGAHA